jgi:hypothetical protein
VGVGERIEGQGLRGKGGKRIVRQGDSFWGSASAVVASINHDPRYHGELYYLSNTIIVLIFSELASFVRKILQAEENKGVELAGGGKEN